MTAAVIGSPAVLEADTRAHPSLANAAAILPCASASGSASSC